MKWTKIIIINLLVLGSLIVLVEVVLRLTQTSMSCLTSSCDFRFVSKIKIYKVKRQSDNLIHNPIGRFDKQLGRVPREGFDAVITRKSWNNAHVTITDEGFRQNDNNNITMPSDILVAGDSFTFGAEVSNHETWPSCLERKLNRGVDNAGVPGYGAAQALRRATEKLALKNYSTLVLSVLVGSDFSRDRLSYRNGNPKPALIQEDHHIVWSRIADPTKPGTKYNPIGPGLLTFFYERSSLVHLIVTKEFRRIDLTGYSLTEVHPRAADKNAIIEWTLKEFSKLNLQKKILLLQYDKRYARDDVSEERNSILRVAKNLNLDVVDTLVELKKYPRKELWKIHHTARGNEVVCEYLFQKEFK
jgi:hypothetical protein